MFRSETISHYELVMPDINAWEIMNELGSQDCIHFLNESSSNEIASSKPYFRMIKRCDDTLDNCHRIQDICQQNGWEAVISDDQEQFLTILKSNLKRQDIEERKYFDMIEQEVEDHEKKQIQLVKSRDSILETIQRNKEYREVQMKVQMSLPENFNIMDQSDLLHFMNSKPLINFKFLIL